MSDLTPTDDDITYFGKANFRNREKVFGIRRDDRRRHMYVLGKTGTGKSTLLENLALSDIEKGEGVAFFDPHGEAVERLLDYIPSSRVNDVVYMNPADAAFPIGFNILEVKDQTQKHLVASGLMAVFTKLWANVWSARMEYILNNTVLALLDTPGNTLLGIPRMYTDRKFRNKIVANIKDPVVKNFWEGEYANYNEKLRTDAISPIQNKVGQFLSSSLIRNIVAQTKSTIDFRDIMDNRKILLVNLSKGRIGEDSSSLLGAMMITKLQLAAMSRVDTPERERKDFYLYVDEFQNFATEAFATILSEARKYKLNLIIAHQYISQLFDSKSRSAPVRDAVFGNVGTIIIFRTGADDAEFLEKEFEPVFEMNDLVNLSKYHIYLKLMINGVASTPFSAVTLPPISKPTGNRDKVIKVSRERYASPREEIEKKISKWLNVEYFAEVGKSAASDTDDDEETAVRLEAFKEPAPKTEVKPVQKPRPPVFEHKRKPQEQPKPRPPAAPQKPKGDRIWDQVVEMQEEKTSDTAKDIADKITEMLGKPTGSEDTEAEQNNNPDPSKLKPGQKMKFD